MSSSKVWYVTGASQGLGLILVRKLLESGHRVAATSRHTQTLEKSIGLFNEDFFLPQEVDLNNPESIDASVRQTINKFGRIDVVVNNAGYGMAGTVEEITSQDIHNIFEEQTHFVPPVKTR